MYKDMSISCWCYIKTGSTKPSYYFFVIPNFCCVRPPQNIAMHYASALAQLHFFRQSCIRSIS
ncbi:MAG TPA: hypothetical protein VJN02_04145, partial [Gammaproteobacteria bacterium]|nr:hypothetical protein [Gammaproteobacteria bacterium]